MTLFEECKEALSPDFVVIEPQSQKDVVDVLNKYFLVNGNIAWSEIQHSDYEDINEILMKHNLKNDDVFVFADDVGIPIFRTKLGSIAKNIYDVTALSSKLLIFNDEIILYPLFPTERIRFGIKN
ncbi:hypothetical protein ACQK5W_05445 [Pantoea sp. FN060301]|uniref:CDI toxin immunity protein n=1 Tax=Pantoea sp. FN060301 TaxID=3420380 RepID=UPI003D176A73